MSHHRRHILPACIVLGMFFMLIPPTSFSADTILREGSKAVEYVEWFGGKKPLLAVQRAQDQGVKVTKENGWLELSTDKGASYLISNFLDAERVTGVDLSNAQEFEISTTVRSSGKYSGRYGIYWNGQSNKNLSEFVVIPPFAKINNGKMEISGLFSVGQVTNGTWQGTDWKTSPIDESQRKQKADMLLALVGEQMKIMAKRKRGPNTKKVTAIGALMALEKEHPSIYKNAILYKSTLTVRQSKGKLVCLIDDKEVFSTTDRKSLVTLGDFGLFFSRGSDKAIKKIDLAIRDFSVKVAAEPASIERGEEAFQRGQYKVALSHFRPLAEQGNHTTAQMSLAQMYWQGIGVEKNFKQAVHWFKQASDLGDIRADGYLGEAYLTGPEGIRDYGKAKALFKKLTAKPNAMYNEAAFKLGSMAGMGLGGPKDIQEAKTWFNLATYSGIPHPGALHSLGVIHYQGLDGGQDFKKARKYFKQAAERGAVMSLVVLGHIDGRGQGVQIDLVKSYNWFYSAAQKMPPGPQKNEVEVSMEQLAAGMTPVQKKQAEEMSRAWLNKWGHNYR